MYKKYIIFTLSTLLTTQSFANLDISSQRSKDCHMIAKACVKAGYISKKLHHRFWQDCMKPILTGEKVRGIRIESSVANDCRVDKIKELKRDLHDLEKISD